jgi:hypothetical protein
MALDSDTDVDADEAQAAPAADRPLRELRGGGHECKYGVDDEIRHLDAIYWHWPNLLDTLKAGGWDIVEDLINVSVLIIDEMGGGHVVVELCQNGATHARLPANSLPGRVQCAQWTS